METPTFEVAALRRGCLNSERSEENRACTVRCVPIQRKGRSEGINTRGGYKSGFSQNRKARLFKVQLSF